MAVARVRAPKQQRVGCWLTGDSLMDVRAGPPPLLIQFDRSREGPAALFLSTRLGLRTGTYSAKRARAIAATLLRR